MKVILRTLAAGTLCLGILAGAISCGEGTTPPTAIAEPTSQGSSSSNMIPVRLAGNRALGKPPTEIPAERASAEEETREPEVVAPSPTAPTEPTTVPKEPTTAPTEPTPKPTTVPTEAPEPEPVEPPAPETTPAQTQAAPTPETVSGYADNLSPIFRKDGTILEIEEQQRDCIKRSITPEEVVWIIQDYPDPGGISTILDCLEHDGKLRFYMQNMLSETGDLEETTSACIRERFKEEDIARIMNPRETDQEEMDYVDHPAIQVGAVFLMLSCMNQQELEEIPDSPIGIEDMEAANCVIAMSGGETEMLNNMREARGRARTFFLKRTAECGLKKPRE